MNAPRKPRASSAGGFFLAMSIIAGVFIGGLLGQPSIGLLAGAAVGVAINGAMWLRDRHMDPPSS